VPTVLYIVERFGSDPRQAIEQAVNNARDNDTVAAIVGAAVGALHGLSALPVRWTAGLLGRTASDDDGQVFRLIARAGEAFGYGTTPGLRRLAARFS
jgi:ADP-ribosylglycohydrolase